RVAGSGDHCARPRIRRARRRADRGSVAGGPAGLRTEGPRWSVLITGANRGLGLEFARQYAGAGWRVYATCRTPAEAPDLTGLSRRADSQLTVHALDVRDREQVRALAIHLPGPPLPVLLNNGAVWGSPHQTLGHIDDRLWADVLDVDLMGPLRMVEAFLDHVEASRRKVLVMLSSRLASIASNDTGGRYMYRSAKTGLNALVKALAVDLAARGLVCVALSPGWARTEMGGHRRPFRSRRASLACGR